ncbi:MAG: peptidoglycan DD-metalloendopeptidase family protein [Desulfovibrionales bacterium]
MIRDFNPPRSVRRSRLKGKKRLPVLVGTILILVLAFALAQNRSEQGIQASIQPATDEVPDTEPAIAPEIVPDPEPVIPPSPPMALTEGVVKSGQTAAVILQEYLSPSEIHVLSQECRDVFALNRLQAGKPYCIGTVENQFARFEYEISSEEKLIVTREGQDFSVTREAIEYDLERKVVSGTITDNLFNTVANAGETAELAIMLADIFAWDVDFARDIRSGDSFKVLVDKRYRNGEFAGYGRIQAAEFVNKGEPFRGFLFEEKEGSPSYFDEQGRSLRKIFLKAPLSFRRISSGYTHSRLHPILKYRRPHLGIDYAAPTGTPVWSVGDGTVIRKSYNKEAGYFIRIRHNSVYETQYNHLSKYPPGMAVGKRVRQGQTIGYVGSTGYSTGPHLDFRMYKNGSNINPNRVKFPSADPISKDKLEVFKDHIQPLLAELEDHTKAVADAAQAPSPAAQQGM